MKKQPKSAVRYGHGMRSAHCSICRHYISPGKCEKVEGQINPDAWCRLFARKPAK